MMMPNGTTQLMGLIGKNISYTLSPVIHNTALNYFKINAVYLPISLNEVNIKDFVSVAWDLGALGFNVTKPHKESVARLFPDSGLRSVNTLYRGKDWWIPASTDGLGFVRGVERLGRSIGSFEHMVILGSGGATQAIISHILERMDHPSNSNKMRISIFCRSPEKFDQAFLGSSPFISTQVLNPKSVKKCLMGSTSDTLLVQATSGPHQGDMMDEYTTVLADFNGVFVDLIYDKPSKIYFAALAKDILAQDGEAMLIEQARLSQELWWGKSLSYEIIRESMRQHKK
jgi:shikimate dehydrogenase